MKTHEERYTIIMLQRQKLYIEIGFGAFQGLQFHYYVCHACKDGLKSLQGEDNIIIKMVEHIASESHKILLGDF